MISSLWAWSFGLSWRTDVHEWASNQHGIWSFLWALAFVFLRISARYGLRHFMLHVAKMASHAIFQYNVLAIDDTHNTWTNMIVKMNISRLF